MVRALLVGGSLWRGRAASVSSSFPVKCLPIPIMVDMQPASLMRKPCYHARAEQAILRARWVALSVPFGHQENLPGPEP